VLRERESGVRSAPGHESRQWNVIHQETNTMYESALPALGANRRLNIATCAALALFTATACSERPADKSNNMLGLPSFLTAEGYSSRSASAQAENQAPRATGSGRIDFPPGGPERNRKPTRDKYQTFSFDIRDRDNNSIPDNNSFLKFTDHRNPGPGPCRNNGNRDCTLIATQFLSFTPIAPNLECPDGSALITGLVDVKNTKNVNESFEFSLKVCDKEDPGKTFPNDTYDFSVPGMGNDPDTDESYRMHFHDPFAAEELEGAYLTGGNIQVRTI
jgi:hypothetical protein